MLKSKAEMGKEKVIVNQLNRECACCSRKIKVFLYNSCTYRGGHFFGKIPIYDKKRLNFEKTKKVEINGIALDVLQNTPKPQRYEEYWECPQCYWDY